MNNNINPMAMMKIAGLIEKFKNNHPKFFPFLKDAGSRITAGSIIEITITDPNGDSITSNIRVTADDLEMIETMKTMGQQ